MYGFIYPRSSSCFEFVFWAGGAGLFRPSTLARDAEQEACRNRAAEVAL
jgi:hypothetical protein